MQDTTGAGGNENDKNEKQVSLSWAEPSAQAKAPSTPPAQKNETKLSVPKVDPASMTTARLVGMVVVGIVVGVVVAWGWVALRSSQSGAVVAKDGENATTTSAVGGGSSSSFSVVSPQAAGKTVSIEKAAVASPTWVVVYENRDGKPGNALGAALFFPSRQTGAVELLRATVPGKTYLIAKQVDNGDRKFSLKNDQLVSENGVVQWVTLEVR